MQGEVSNYKAHPSGHQYFTLKDSRAQISCVIFQQRDGAAAETADGRRAGAGLRADFRFRGARTISIERADSSAAGSRRAQAKFEALKRKLEAEGLFDPARKRPLPRHPRRIRHCHFPSGAAIRDMLNVLARRGRNLQILINPVRVRAVEQRRRLRRRFERLSLPNEELGAARCARDRARRWQHRRPLGIQRRSCGSRDLRDRRFQSSRRSATKSISRSPISWPICGHRRRARRRN